METRYAQLARLLAADIASGKRAVGSTLPKEVELAEQFGVSRATVRAALRELQQIGLISRRRHAGTRVETMRPTGSEDGFHQALSSIDDLVQYAEETERKIQFVASKIADKALAARLGSRPGSRWLHAAMLRVHSLDATRPPICWTDLYLDEAFVGLRDQLNSHRGLVSELVERSYGRCIAEVQQTITAAGVPSDLTGPLNSPPGTPALQIRRRYLDAAGAALLVTISTHPADRFSYEISLRRQRT